MIVICPRCSTPYAIPPEAIGQGGRTVRCSACGYAWQQRLQDTGEGTHAAVASAPPPIQNTVPPPSPPATPPADPFDIATLSAEPPAEPDQDALRAGDDEAAAAANPQIGVGDDDGIDFADEPSPEPEEAVAPQEPAARAGKPEPTVAKGKSRLLRKHWIVGASAAGATLIMLMGLAIAFQKSLVATIPATHALFALFETPPPPLGAGLEIRDVSTSRRLQGIQEIIVVTGSVMNLTEENQTVPALRISLVDAADQTLQTTVVAAGKHSATAHGSVPFEAILSDPGDQARNLKIAFAPQEDLSGSGSATEHGADAGAAGHSATEPPTDHANPHSSSSQPAPAAAPDQHRGGH